MRRSRRSSRSSAPRLRCLARRRRSRTRPCCGPCRRRAARSTAPRAVAPHAQRGGRAALRDRPVTDADGTPGRRPARRSAPRRPDTLVVPLKRLAAGLVPRLLARDLRGRPSGARRLHVRRRPEPGAGAAVRAPVASGDGGDADARRRALARVPRRRWPRSGCSRSRLAIARPLVAPRVRDSLRRGRRSPSPSRSPSALSRCRLPAGRRRRSSRSGR